MDEVRPIIAHTRVGVECLTLWMEPDRVSAALHIALLKQDPDEADGMIVGLLNLSHKLLLKLARERGATLRREEKVPRDPSRPVAQAPGVAAG